MFCTKCGAKNEDGALFCMQCGSRLTAAEPEPEELVEEPVEEVVAPRRRESTKRRGAYAKPKRSKAPLVIAIAAVAVVAVVVIIMASNNSGSAQNQLLNQIYLCEDENTKELSSVFEYDENQNLAAEIHYSDSQLSYVDDYDQNGNIVKRTYYFMQDDDKGYDIDLWYEYEYEYQNDKMVRSYAYYYNRYYDRVYDSDGNLTNIEVVEEYDSTEICDYEYEYDSDGNLSRTKLYFQYSGDYWWNIMTYEYDNNGNLEYEYRYYCDDPDDESTYESIYGKKYEYSKSGAIENVLNLTRSGTVEAWNYWYEYEYVDPEDVKATGDTLESITFYDYQDELDAAIAETEDKLAEESDSSDLQSWDTIYFGSYEQDNDTSNGGEAIEWLVLDQQDGKTLILSKYLLDCQAYDSAYEVDNQKEANWETSSMRNWLNNDFLNTAFDDEELGSILDTTLNEDGQEVFDKIFLLSSEEAELYFTSDEARKAHPTAYAYAQLGMVGYDEASDQIYLFQDGISVNLSLPISEYDENFTSSWWLRSTYEGYYVTYVGNNTHGLTISSPMGVRPAMWVETATTESTETIETISNASGETQAAEVLNIETGEFEELTFDADDVMQWDEFVDEYPDVVCILKLSGEEFEEYTESMWICEFQLRDSDGNLLERAGAFNITGYDGTDPVGWGETYGPITYQSSDGYDSYTYYIRYQDTIVMGPASIEINTYTAPTPDEDNVLFNTIVTGFQAENYAGDWVWYGEGDLTGTLSLQADSNYTLTGSLIFYRLFRDELVITSDANGYADVTSELGNFTGTAFFGEDEINISFDDKQVYGNSTISEMLGTSNFLFVAEDTVVSAAPK